MNFIRDLFQSFFSPHFYSNLARERGGIGASYILALSLILLLPVPFVLANMDLLPGVAGFGAGLPPAPTITIKSGVLSIDKPVPYTLPIGTTGLNVVVDTSYKISDMKALADRMEKEKIVELVTADSMATVGGDGARIQDYSKWKDTTITAQNINDLVQSLRGSGGLVLLALSALACLAGLFIYGLIATFFTAIVASIVGLVANAGLDLAAAMRLAAALRVPVTLLSFLPFMGWTVGWLLWFAYIIFAVVSCRATPQKAA